MHKLCVLRCPNSTSALRVVKRQAVGKNVLTILLSACSSRDGNLRLVIFNDSLAFPCWFRPVCKASSVTASSVQRPVIILKSLKEQGISLFYIAVDAPWYQVQRTLAVSIINEAGTTIEKGINKDNNNKRLHTVLARGTKADTLRYC